MATIRLVVDEQELAVVLAFGLGDGRVVGITPGDRLAVDHALVQHGLGLFVEAVALPGFGGEDTDILEDAGTGNLLKCTKPGSRRTPYLNEH